MGITLNQVSWNLKDLQIDDIRVDNVLFKGVQLLVEYANSFWDEMLKEICPPMYTFTELVKTIRLEKQDSDLDTYAALAIQQAYLEVFQTTLKEVKDTLEVRFDLDDVADIDEQWRNKLLTSVEEFKECDIDAVRIDFPNLHDEPFVKNHLEKLAADWFRMRLFRKDGEEYEAANLARRISYQLYPHLLKIIAEHGELYAPLPEYFDVVNHRELQKHSDIEKYRAFLMQLPAKPIFHGIFALQDLYVELEATDIVLLSKKRYLIQPKVAGNELLEKEDSVQLMQTVLKQLDVRGPIILIQAGPGKGKSVFCQMLAARMAAERPNWIPILIRPGDKPFITGNSFNEIIKNSIEPYFTLTDDLLKTRRFLFILDGLDDLWPPTEFGHTFKRFFEQLAIFQKTYTEKDGWGHRFVITARPVRLQDIESGLPLNLLHLKIKNVEIPQFEMWLKNWEKLFGEDTANAFREVLERGKVFDQSENAYRNSIKGLVSELLLLYMLGAMHRDGALPQDVLETSPQRIEIYDRVVSWACEDTRKYHAVHHSNRVIERSGMKPYQLRRLLQEIALCIWHGRRESTSITRITKHLRDVAPEPVKKLTASDFDGMQTVLVSLPLQRYEGDNRHVEFFHKSFREYLAAEKMVETLMRLGERILNRYSQQGEYRINTMKEVAYHFYSVFGIALLSSEIYNFVMDILPRNFSLEEIKQVTKRLYHLYIDYSDGRWFDAGISKIQWDELKRYDGRTGLLQFEAQAGINLFVFLCLLYQQIDATFEICGREEDGTFDSNRFRRLVGLGEIAGTFGLLRRVHGFLSKVNLQRADLLCVNLRRATLQKANLQGAILREAILREANLEGASLQGADLRVANVQDVNLQDADLQGANLEEADLRDANLQGANMQDANLLCADLRDADFRRAVLRRVVLYGANLRGALLHDADVTGTIISQQHLATFRELFSDEQIAQLNVVQD